MSRTHYTGPAPRKPYLGLNFGRHRLATPSRPNRFRRRTIREDHWGLSVRDLVLLNHGSDSRRNTKIGRPENIDSQTEGRFHDDIVARGVIIAFAVKLDADPKTYGREVPTFCFTIAVSLALSVPVAFTSERKFVISTIWPRRPFVWATSVAFTVPLAFA